MEEELVGGALEQGLCDSENVSFQDSHTFVPVLGSSAIMQDFSLCEKTQDW